MFEIIEQKIREKASRIINLTEKQKEKILKYFNDWLETKFIAEKTKKYYVTGAMEILGAKDTDTIVTFCMYSQNTRTVLKYLDEIRDVLDKEGELR